VARLTGLWAQRPFALLWTGQTVSRLGSQVTLVALPLTAILVLDATPLQVGLLTAIGFVPAAIFGLLAGVWVDRVRRRSMQIVCQLALAATTISVPVAAWLGLLRLEQLFVVEALNGALTVLSVAAGQAYLPTLVGGSQLTEANAKLATSTAAAGVVGPGFAGVLIQLTSAPIAIVVDAVSFLISAVCLLRIRVREPAPKTMVRRGIASEIQEGVYLVLGHRLIRPLMLSGGAYNFFAAIFVAVSTLFMVRDLGFGPATLGAVIACGGVGGVLGSMAAASAANRFGVGRAIVGSMILLAVAHLAAPAASGPQQVTAPLLAAAALCAQFGVGVLVVNRTTLIQQLVPAYAQGRVAATQQVIGLGAVPIGAALGGVLGEVLGLRATVGIAAIGTIGATLALLRSPLWTTLRVDELEERQQSGEDRPGEPPTGASATLWYVHRHASASATPN
jgi:MFS family permease